MSKRKRLCDRRETYNETGTPCGNPKRVQTGEVLCMPGGSRLSSATQDEDGLETEGERQLRAMAHSQLNTSITMAELLSKRRQFQEAGRYKPMTQEVRGMMGLQDYQQLARGDQRVEALRQCGLTDDQVRLQLSKEGVPLRPEASMTSKSTFGMDPAVEQEQLVAIDARLQEHERELSQPVAVRGLKEVSRQQMDLERALFSGAQRPGTDLRLLAERGGNPCADPADPANHLPQILEELEERARQKVKDKRRRRRRQRRGRGNGDGVGSGDGDDDGNRGGDGNGGGDSDAAAEDDSGDGDFIGCLTREETLALQQGAHLLDLCNQSVRDTTAPETPDQQLQCKKLDHIECRPGSVTTDVCKDPVEKAEKGSEAGSEDARKVLRGPVEFVPEKYMEENRLSIEEIRKLPKFSNYETGNASNILYLKNLSPRVCERDLVSVFGRLQEETGSEIVYKLMKGRMRGQAFVTFSGAELAERAMSLVNGFLLHGKPVIAQYGKKTTS